MIVRKNSTFLKTITYKLYTNLIEFIYNTVFDEHETEDCPKQESLEQEVKTHSSYHAIRTERRPYCDACEMFGHSISDCPQNNETF